MSPPPPARRRWALLAAGALLVVVLVGGRWLALETAERAWAESVAGGGVYLAGRDLARLVRGFILFAAVAWATGNLYFVYRAIGSVQLPRRLGDLDIVEAIPQRVLLACTVASGLVFGLALTWGTGDWWLKVALAGAPPQFGVSDPVLHRDPGYYLGELPWDATLQGRAVVAIIAVALLVALLYLGIGSLRIERGRATVSPHARLHLGILLACLALALAWGAVLDPAELVAGLDGAADRAALDVRIPGAAFLAAVSVGVAAASLAWAWRERKSLVVGGWMALLISLVAVHLLLPAILRGARPRADRAPDPALAAERRALEPLAFGVEWLEERAPPEFATGEAAVAAVPLWDRDRVAAVAQQSGALGAGGVVAGVALRPAPADGGRPTWLVAAAPEAPALERGPSQPSWTEIHRGRRAWTGPPLLAVEADTGLLVRRAPVADSAAWFGPGFRDFAVAAPDTWPDIRAGGIRLAGWWRRTALAWALQSPELARSETDGLLLLWRRDARDRLARLAPFADFETPAPVLLNSSLWWVAYGYVHGEAFPLARAVTWNNRRVRYLRAGLIGAVHAAGGDTRVYLAPGYDSLSAAWARLFRPLVWPLDSLPAALRAQLAYPEEAFARATAYLIHSRPDSEAWTPRPRAPFELAAPRLWTAQGFETRGGAPARFAALVAGTVTPAGPRLFLWRPPVPVRLPAPLFGSPQTKPGILRLWLAGGSLLSLQGLFAEAAARGGPPQLTQAYLSWGKRVGQGVAATAALRDLLATGSQALLADTSLAARWAVARRLAVQADSALAAGDLERFGRLYADLKSVLGVERARQLAPAPRPD